MSNQIQRARVMRKTLTPWETLLWSRLRGLRSQGFHFRRQAPFQRYILDFVCFSGRLSIEVDGSQHLEGNQLIRDVARDTTLRRAGFRVLRVGNNEINTNLEGVMETILQILSASPPHLAGSASHPPHRGEGGITRQPMTRDPFQPWLDRWRLTPDGEAFATAFGSHLLPVRRGGEAAMLKIATGAEERLGAALMVWWAGDGAARVLAHEDPALLLERALGARSLAAMARGQQDEEAMRILCAAAQRLHVPRPAPPPATLVPLAVWFRALPASAETRGGVFNAAWAAARELLAHPRDVAPLHGDLHHGNVLDFGPRGWLAIDPKGLIGERGYDYAGMVCNPDIETAGAPGALMRRSAILCAQAGLEIRRHLRWVLAYAGLSAAWTLDSGGEATPAITLAELAARELAAL